MRIVGELTAKLCHARHWCFCRLLELRGLMYQEIRCLGRLENLWLVWSLISWTIDALLQGFIVPLILSLFSSLHVKDIDSFRGVEIYTIFNSNLAWSFFDLMKVGATGKDRRRFSYSSEVVDFYHVMLLVHMSKHLMIASSFEGMRFLGLSRRSSGLCHRGCCCVLRLIFSSHIQVTYQLMLIFYWNSQQFLTFFFNYHQVLAIKICPLEVCLSFERLGLSNQWNFAGQLMSYRFVLTWMFFLNASLWYAFLNDFTSIRAFSID